MDSYGNRKERTVRGMYIPEDLEGVLSPGLRATRPLQ